MSSYNFQEDLEKSLLGADERLDKKELLIDIFKTYVAKLFEITINKSSNKERIALSALVEVKRNLINEFRQASIGEYQLSIKKYEELFDNTVQEIINFASSRHAGQDSVSVDQSLNVNKRAFWDTHTLTDSGIIVSKN